MIYIIGIMDIKVYHGERIFNLWSVLQALDENLIENYCTN